MDNDNLTKYLTNLKSKMFAGNNKTLDTFILEAQSTTTGFFSAARKLLGQSNATTEKLEEIYTEWSRDHTALQNYTKMQKTDTDGWAGIQEKMKEISVAIPLFNEAISEIIRLNLDNARVSELKQQ